MHVLRARLRHPPCRPSVHRLPALHRLHSCTFVPNAPDFTFTTMDLSPASLVCAFAICVFSFWHIYLWSKEHDKFRLVLVLTRSVVAWLSLVGLITSIVAFAFWQKCKKQPQCACQYEYLSVLVVPWVYGLIVEVCIHSFGQYTRLNALGLHFLADPESSCSFVATLVCRRDRRCGYNHNPILRSLWRCRGKGNDTSFCWKSHILYRSDT